MHYFEKACHFISSHWCWLFLCTELSHLVMCAYIHLRGHLLRTGIIWFCIWPTRLHALLLPWAVFPGIWEEFCNKMLIASTNFLCVWPSSFPKCLSHSCLAAVFSLLSLEGSMLLTVPLLSSLFYFTRGDWCAPNCPVLPSSSWLFRVLLRFARRQAELRQGRCGTLDC